MHEICCVKGVVRDSAFEITIKSRKKEVFEKNGLKVVADQLINGDLISHEMMFELMSVESIDGMFFGVLTAKIDKSILPIKHIHVYEKTRKLPVVENNENWQLRNLYIDSKEEFDAEFRSAKSRPKDLDTLMFISMQNAQFNNYDIRHGIASYVVFCYKAMELDAKNILKEKYFLFEYYEDKIPEIIELRGNIREDGRQVCLSFYYVKWQVDIYLGNFNKVEKSLDEINKMPQLYDFYKPSLSLNYGNSLLLKGFIKEKQGEQEIAKSFYQRLYRYYKDLILKLPDTPTVPVAHFDDIGHCHRACYYAIAAYKNLADLEEHKVVVTANKILKTVGRVTGSKKFNEKFMEFIDWCSDFKTTQSNSNSIVKSTENIGHDSSEYMMEIKKKDLYIKKLQMEKQKLQKELNNIKRQKRSIERSLSWRVTSPLRAINKILVKHKEN